MGLQHNGTGRGWDCNTMELVVNGTATQWNWYKMGLQHNGTGSEWDCDTKELVQNGTATQCDCYSMGCGAMVLLQHGTAA